VALRRPGERAILSGLALVAYLFVAVVVVLDAHSIIGDAWSRVANAYYVLYSRDPHLAAVGFVWNPLPSLAVLPLLPLKLIWPGIVATGFAGCIVSAICMAGAVWQVNGIAADWNVRRAGRWVLTLAFAFNPMILYYAANGMSEAMFIFTLLIGTRYLARWGRSGEIVPLVIAGVALAAGYMTRYEAVVAALGGVMAVAILSVIRRPGPIRDRLAEGLADATIFATPFATAFVGWAIASWLIVKDPFQQFTSVYGVVSQLEVAQTAVAQSTGQGSSSAFVWIARQMVGLEPGIILILVFALVAMLRGRHPLVLAGGAVLGAVVAFAAFGFLTGRTLGWLRYSIAIIPLATVLAIAVLAPSSGHELVGRPGAERLRLWGGRLAGLAVVLLVLAAVPVGAMTMLDPAQNPAYGGEAFQLRPVLFPNEPMVKFTPQGQYDVGRLTVEYLDPLKLGNGEVLVDGAMGFPMILESNNPKQFITTSDRDFQQTLLDPGAFGVKYLLVPENVGYQSLDALNRTYPTIYRDGAGISTLVREFSAGGNNWRLYRVGQ